MSLSDSPFKEVTVAGVGIVYCPYLVSWLYIPPVCVEGPLPGGCPRHPPAGDHLDGRRGRGGAARGLRPRRVLRLPQGGVETQRYVYNINHHKQTIYGFWVGNYLILTA